MATILIIFPKINWPTWQILCSLNVCICFVWKIRGPGPPGTPLSTPLMTTTSTTNKTSHQNRWQSPGNQVCAAFHLSLQQNQQINFSWHKLSRGLVYQFHHLKHTFPKKTFSGMVRLWFSLSSIDWWLVAGLWPSDKSVALHQNFKCDLTLLFPQYWVTQCIQLSLIHIWRCRRIERCRSRWSPYH